MDGDGELQPDKLKGIGSPTPGLGDDCRGRGGRERDDGRRRNAEENAADDGDEDDENGNDMHDNETDANNDHDNEADDGGGGDSGGINNSGHNNNNEDSEDGDTTDGGPPQSLQEKVSEVFKRPHIQSRRMQEYQAMQQLTSHEGRRRWRCRVPSCQRTFNSAPGLRYHQQTHLPVNESFICDTCRKEFKSNNGLKYHRKKKRCQGHPIGIASDLVDPQASSSSSTGSRVLPPPLSLHQAGGDYANQRLMDLAKIATGPQSPLIQTRRPEWERSVSASHFDSSETSAVMALSVMAQRSSQSRRSRIGQESTFSGRGGPPHQSGMNSKRPMNGFMLFAQKNRAGFNRMFPHTNNRMISTKLSEEWNKLSEEERQKWKGEARQKAEEQRRKNPDCWKRKKYSRDGH